MFGGSSNNVATGVIGRNYSDDHPNEENQHNTASKRRHNQRSSPNNKSKLLSKVAKLRADFTSHNHSKLLHDAVFYERVKQEQMLYRERVDAIEQSITKRTLFVSNLPYDGSKHPELLKHLNRFFEKEYGPVERCYVSSWLMKFYNNRRNISNFNMDRMLSENSKNKGPPPIRVQFQQEEHLKEVLKPFKGKGGEIECPGLVSIPSSRNNGRRGRYGTSNNPNYKCNRRKQQQQSSLESNRVKIHVRKSLPCDNVTLEMIQSLIIELPAIGLSVGHWTPDDIFTEWDYSNKKDADNTNANINNRNITTSAAVASVGIDSSFSDDSTNNNDGSNNISSYNRNHKTNDTGQWLEGCRLDNSTNDLMIKFDLRKRMMVLSVTRQTDSNLQFDFSSSTDYATFRFKDIDGYIDLCYDNGDDDGNTGYPNYHTIRRPSEAQYFSLILTLKYPPRLTSDKPIFGLGYSFEQHSDRNDQQQDENECYRDLVFGGIHATMFGKYHGLKINLSKDSVEALLLNNKGLRQLQSFGIFRSNLLNVFDSRFVDTIPINTLSAHERTLERSMENLHQYDPTLGFVFRSLLDQGRFSWYHAFRDLAKDKDGEKRDIFTFLRLVPLHVSLEALIQLSKACGKTKYPCQLFNMLVDLDIEEPKVMNHCVSIPRVFITPCRQVANFFESETSNRVIRKFIEEEDFSSDSFLRVQICEENGSKLFFSDLTDVVLSRIKSAILDGIVLNGKSYKFLAYSSSQLKEFSLWMVCPQNGWTTESMRASMGDFSACNTPYKYSARIGQCFSTTFKVLAGQDTKLFGSQQTSLRHKVVHDIMASNNMAHSDGCGLISTGAMTMLLKMLPHRTKDVVENTSVVQIRYGGSKGILVSWDSHVLEGTVPPNQPTWYDVVLRRSMVKFSAPFNFIEICRVGSHVPYYLNRNVVLLLGTRGVNDNVFRSMQKEMLDDLEAMLDSREKAIKLVSRLGGPDQRQRTRLLNVLYSGLSPRSDPFLFSCCLAIRSHHLYGLRKKARIFIEKGVVLVGGLDETGLLPEFCVFLQVRKRPTAWNDFDKADEFHPIIGPVMVTKHPVMHPGDVRMLLAVDVPELRGQKHVLLFSQHGRRPESNKMAGSDLDGDEYAITWDPRLLLGEWNNVRCNDGIFVSHLGKKVSSENHEDARLLQHSNSTPLDYGSPAPSLKNHRINDNTLVDHLIHYAINDNLGRIGMLWQDWAASKGADCRQCIDLATQHSIAVDFAKTGIPARIPDNTKWNGPRAHWREKNDEPSYHCRKIIGKLYDDVILRGNSKKLHSFEDALAGRYLDRYGQVLSITKDSPDLRQIYIPAIPLKLGWTFDNTEFDIVQRRMEKFALEQRIFYEEHVLQMMNKYNLKNEGELFTGCIRKFHRLHKKRQHEVSEDVRRQCRDMCDEYRSSFFLEVLDIAEEYFGVTNVSALQSGLSSFPHPDDNEPFSDLMKNVGEDLCNDDDEGKREAVYEAQAWATDIHFSDSERSHSWIIRKTARQLAAAYYLETYSPFREFQDDFALFSFPWLVADVIACCMRTSKS